MKIGYVENLDDAFDDMSRLSIKLKMAVFDRVIEAVNLVETDEANGVDAADISLKLRERLDQIVHGRTLEQFLQFTLEFNRCMSCGPGCDHDEDDHDALARVWALRNP